MKYKISFVGAGNVAWHLAQALETAGHHIREVFSQDIANAELLCSHLYDATAKENLDFSESDAQILFIAVADDALESILSNLIVPQFMIVAHTSGTKPISIFEDNATDCAYNYGVFYPLQTFSKQKPVDFSEIPFCIEANDTLILDILQNIAKTVSKNVLPISSKERQILHVAAVFACNFVNHLLAISKNILDVNHLDFKMLVPLIKETIHKALLESPENVQTGPAKRKDFKTIEKHLQFLSKENDTNNNSNNMHKEIYKMLTESIVKGF